MGRPCGIGVEGRGFFPNTSWVFLPHLRPLGVIQCGRVAAINTINHLHIRDQEHPHRSVARRGCFISKLYKRQCCATHLDIRLLVFRTTTSSLVLSAVSGIRIVSYSLIDHLRRHRFLLYSFIVSSLRLESSGLNLSAEPSFFQHVYKRTRGSLTYPDADEES